MAYTTPLYGTGYEMGALPLSAGNILRAYIHSTNPRTGTYCMRVEGAGAPYDAWARIPVPGTTSELYVSGYIYTQNYGYTAFGVVLDTGEVVELRKGISTYTWDLYIDGSLAQAGSIAVPPNQYQNVQAYFNIDNSGAVQTKIDGVDDIDYSGDTQPGAGNTISYVRQYQLWEASWSLWDDISFGLGDWGGDIRFDGIVPDSDDSVEWTPSTGADNYALVDERPPSTVDYVSTSGSGLTDKYTLGDWSGAAKTPQFVVAWAYAKKDTAGSIQLQLLVDSNADEDVSPALDLSTSDAYYSHLVAEDPDAAGAWTDSTIDALKVGIRSA